MLIETLFKVYLLCEFKRHEINLIIKVLIEFTYFNTKKIYSLFWLYESKRQIILYI